jgi:hypothetical protein
MDIRDTLLAALLSVMAGALAGFGLAWSWQESRYEAAIAAIKAEAAETLATQTEAVRQADRAWIATRDKMETDHAQALALVSQEAAAARAAVAAAGGLRDPGRRPGGGCPVPGAAQPAAGPDGATADSRLSDAAAGFLFDQAERADRLAVLAATCHDYAVAVQAHSEGER